MVVLVAAAGQSRSRTFSCRLLIKPPDEQDETMEEKQQRVSKYETMQVSSQCLHVEFVQGAIHKRTQPLN